MSYPDLGCFAECLTCEICETGWPDLPPYSPDLTPDLADLWNDFAPGPLDGIGDWEPAPEPSGFFDDFNVPSLDVGPFDISPSWPPGIEISGEF